MHKTDIQLIADYRAGDRQAFEVLVARHLKAVYRFVWRMVRNKSDAEDITQETFLKAWRNIASFDTSCSFTTWLFQIARNSAIDLLRKKKTFVFSDFEDAEGNNPLLENLMDTAPLPDEILAQSEKQGFVHSALENLSRLYRDVLVLRYHEDLSFEEIGAVLGKPLNTVKSQHRRALQALKKILSPDI